MPDFSGYLEKGLSPASWNIKTWAALGADYGRTWGVHVPPADDMPGEWIRNLWGPVQTQQLAAIPPTSWVIGNNEPNLPYHTFKESAGVAPFVAASQYYWARVQRPDIQWAFPAINGVDAWTVGDDGLNFPWFREFIRELMKYIAVSEQFDLPRPFTGLAYYCLQWYETTANIPDAWKLPAWGAQSMIEAAEIAGLQAERWVDITEIGCHYKPHMVQKWWDNCAASPVIRRAYWFTDYAEDKPHYSLCKNTAGELNPTGVVFANLRGGKQ
jgi:hypothetical protein